MFDALREQVALVHQRLSWHPDLLLNMAQVAAASARVVSRSERQERLDLARSLLADHEERFGASSGARALRQRILDVRVRSGATGKDIQQDAVRLLEDQAAQGTLRADEAQRVIHTLERAKALDKKTAEKLKQAFSPLVEGHERRWRGVTERLLKKTGDEGALVALWTQALREGGDDAEALEGLSGRLLRNLREGLGTPFDNSLLDSMLDKLPFGLLGKWQAEDVRRVCEHLQESFGNERASRFIRERILPTRNLRKHNGVWKVVFEVLGASAEPAELASLCREAIREGDAPTPRLRFAELCLEHGKHLEEAVDAIKPLGDKRGEAAKAAHRLRERIQGHPAYKSVRKEGLLAFEERIGVGRGELLELKVIHKTPGYVLVEELSHPAPEAYGHKRLRSLVRTPDLPHGLHPMQMQKGDTLRAPLRGEDGDPSRNKGASRVYWLADAGAVQWALTEEEAQRRITEEEARFGLDSDSPVPVLVSTRCDTLLVM